MAIEKRGGKWWYRFTVRGREYRRTTGLDAERSNLREAESIEARAKLEALAGYEQPKAVPVHLFATAADEFLAWCFSTEYRSKRNTALRIQTSFQSLLLFFDGKTVAEIERNAIEDYKTWRLEVHGIREITLRHDLHALSVFFRKFAIRKGLADHNPVADVSKPSDKGAVRIHVISREEEAAYFATAKGPVYDVHRLMILHGCRPEEIMALEQDAVDLAGMTFRIKGGKSRAAKRELPMTDESARIFARLLEKPNRWVFPSQRKPGRHLTKLNNRHDDVCREAGVSFVPYDFRHTWATRALTEAGMDVATVAAIMGHSSPVIVLRHYVHVQLDAMRTGMKKYEELMKPKLQVVKKKA